MNKIIDFILLFLTLIGIIGGIGYSIYDGRWVIAVGIAVAGYMAWPKVKKVFEEWVEPTPTPEELLARAKANKIAELESYDDSEVNSFSVNGKDMWLDHDLRQQLRISLDALSQAGRENVTKWFDGIEYTYPIDVWYYMLGQVEVYASDALNVTESHKAAINALESIADVEAYEFSGYPDKLSF